MITREAFIQDREKVFDKVYGALSGLAIGDSFGDASRKAENRAAYQVTTENLPLQTSQTSAITCLYS